MTENTDLCTVPDDARRDRGGDRQPAEINQRAGTTHPVQRSAQRGEGVDEQLQNDAHTLGQVGLRSSTRATRVATVRSG
jgi:hypothetical protein